MTSKLSNKELVKLLRFARDCIVPRFCIEPEDPDHRFNNTRDRIEFVADQLEQEDKPPIVHDLGNGTYKNTSGPKIEPLRGLQESSLGGVKYYGNATDLALKVQEIIKHINGGSNAE